MPEARKLKKGKARASMSRLETQNRYLKPARDTQSFILTVIIIGNIHVISSSLQLNKTILGILEKGKNSSLVIHEIGKLKFDLELGVIYLFYASVFR